MAKTFRLTDREEEMLYRTSMNINRELIRIGKSPMNESKILHEILEQTLALGEIEVMRDGQIRVLANELAEPKEQK